MVTFKPSAQFGKNPTLILCSREQLKSKKFSFKNSTITSSITRLLKAKQFSAENGELYPVMVGNSPVVLAGIGNSKECSSTALRIVVRDAIKSAYLKSQKLIDCVLHEENPINVRAVVEGAVLGGYSWKRYKATKDGSKRTASTVTIICSKQKKYEEYVKICEGVNYTRDLVNENADVATSTFIERKIREIIKGNKNTSIKVFNKKEMEKEGLGLHLAVNKGSVNEPKLILVKYTGLANQKNYTALVGKGITFDTGGLNLKPSGSIETMRMDMSGAAAVVGTLKNTIALKLKKNVIFAVGLAENVTGSRSYKPGDVIKGYAGKTVEVANTDAEGRLVLADTISYIVKNYKPKEIIDIATLTGACVVALGHDYTGLVTTDDAFSRALVHASNETDDRVWRLPSYPELKNSVKSQIADIRNLGFPKGAGGTITAAEFLRQFTEGTRWAHLDIAGTAFVDNGSRMYFNHGATGAGVRLLTQYLSNN